MGREGGNDYIKRVVAKGISRRDVKREKKEQEPEKVKVSNKVLPMGESRTHGCGEEKLSLPSKVVAHQPKGREEARGEGARRCKVKPTEKIAKIVRP